MDINKVVSWLEYYERTYRFADSCGLLGDEEEQTPTALEVADRLKKLIDNIKEHNAL